MRAVEDRPGHFLGEKEATRRGEGSGQTVGFARAIEQLRCSLLGFMTEQIGGGSFSVSTALTFPYLFQPLL